MHVIPDANILIADPWLRSQKLRVLLDYLRKTRSQLLLLEPVETEVRAHFKRQVTAAIEGLDSSFRGAERAGLTELPIFSSDAIRDRTFSAWEGNFERTMRPSVHRIPLNEAVLREALRRATERLPPCSSSGKELRDTIIWLNVLSFCRSLPEGTEVAFISLNTSDFAAPDKRSLRPELASDVEMTGRTIQFYASLDDFIKEHSDRIAYITVEWIEEHADLRELERSILAHLEHVEPEIYFRIASGDYQDFYEPRTIEEVYSPSISVDDVFVWRIGGDQIAIRLECSVYAEAEVECTQVQTPSWARQSYYGYDPYEEWRGSRSLTCYSELRVTASAVIANGRVGDVELEEIDLA